MTNFYLSLPVRCGSNTVIRGMRKNRKEKNRFSRNYYRGVKSRTTTTTTLIDHTKSLCSSGARTGKEFFKTTKTIFELRERMYI